ncbi:hypothetical protein FMEAI12_3640082 [Parafrankia sp. Ea1.12]|nr:hypothetical protein FMEAI12_3640082 [Parafrankia sp. Ea1.12]
MFFDERSALLGLGVLVPGKHWIRPGSPARQGLGVRRLT